MAKTLEEEQKYICSKYKLPFYGCDLDLKVGISRNVKDNIKPLNGLRIRPEGDTSGWYIWAGEEWSDDPDFFVPLHGKHIEKWAPILLPYLGFGPGTRFLVTEQYEDVWEDLDLLNN